MTYHPLTADSGSTSERRVEEARDLCRMLADHLEELGPKQRTFVEEMTETVEGTFGQVTVKQLFWLQDIWEKFQ